MLLGFISIKHIQIQYPEGTFHPKLYLFIDSSEKWELIIGSANFTKEVFLQNIEACILLTNKNNNSSETFVNAIKLIEYNTPRKTDSKFKWKTS